jgi:4-hydroxy-4-methyl-2-oxoglutarate aldolase
MGAGEGIVITEYLKTIDTPTLCNAIEVLRVRPQSAGFAPLQLQCLFPEFGRMCGYAVTAQVETVTSSEPLSGAGFYELFDAIEASPKPAVVVLQEIGGYSDYAAHCGEVMATIFTRLGAIGLVSDCGVRDVPEVRAIGMHYFARGRVASHAHFRIVRAGVPVQILGVPIRPGELLHGDENGLATVPHAPQEQIEAAVNQVRDRERALLDYIRGPEFTLPGLRGRFLE